MLGGRCRWEEKPCLKRLPPFVRVTVLDELGARDVPGVGYYDVPRADRRGGFLHGRFVHDIGDVHNDFDVGITLSSEALGFLERLLGSSEDVDGASVGLGKGVDEFSPYPGASSCDYDGLAGLR